MELYVVRAHLSKNAARKVSAEEASTCILVFETEAQAQEFVEGQKMLYDAWKYSEYYNHDGDDQQLPWLVHYKTLSIEKVPFVADPMKIIESIREGKEGE